MSIAEVVRKLGLMVTGGNHSHIKRKLLEHNIDISHFLGKHSNLGKKSAIKKHWKEILIERNDKKRELAFRLRRALIESGRDYKCEICGLKDKWNNKTIRLEVDHKNNRCNDDRPENLRFLCPNCHSQQLHKMNKGLTGLTTETKRKSTKKNKVCNKTNICKQCFNLTKNPNYCSYECSHKSQRKHIYEPSELFDLLKKNNMNYTKTAKIIGVSDNAIRKKLKKANLI